MKRKIKNWLAVFLALIMGLGTLTAQNTVPLTEDFSGVLPDGWTTTGGVTLSSEDGRIQIEYAESGYLITQKVMPTTNNHTLSAVKDNGMLFRFFPTTPGKAPLYNGRKKPHSIL